ncbi:MAG: ParB/RepB/Spo0J family partition protein [Anaerostipes hadrus]|jgi:ParB family chromosome partitioning protein
MDMNDILKSIGQKQPQEKKKSAPRIQMIHYTKLKPSPDNFYDTEGIEKLAAAIRIAGEIKNPLRVRKADIDEYEVNEGHRRRLATIYNVEEMGMNEFEFVPCVVEDTTSTIGKLNLILSNSTQRERTEYEKMQETAKLRILLEQYAKENETKISSTDMRKMISTILGVSGTKVAQLESINRNLVDEAKEQFKDGSMPVSVANEMAGLPEEIQRDLSKQEDIKLSQVKEIKEDSKENAKIMCKYDNSKRCHTKMIQRQQEHLYTNGPCSGCCRLCDHAHGCRYRCENSLTEYETKQQPQEVAKCAYNSKYECNIDEIIEKYKVGRNTAECPGCCKLCGYTFECEHVCENVLENKSITESNLESVTFTFQDVKATLGYVKQQIPETKINDKETITRLKVMSEALKKYLNDMTERVEYNGK